MVRSNQDWGNSQAHLENAGIAVNAHMIKHVPGRKTDMADSEWLAKSTLAAKYRSLMVRKSHKKAIVAVAHKMIRLIFVLLTGGAPYIVCVPRTTPLRR